MTWADVRDAWGPHWWALQREAIDTWEDAIEADPERFRDVVVAFAHTLDQARADLDRIRAALPASPEPEIVAQLTALEQRYVDLAAGLMAEATPAPAVGAVPVALIVLGVVLGVAAIAWAVTAWQYAVNLREQTALVDRELTARIEAARSGRELPPSTLPTPPPSTSSSPVWVVAGGAALVLGAVALPALWRT